MDKIIHDANGELSELRGRMNSKITEYCNWFVLIIKIAMGKEHDYLKQKHEELIQAYREKCRKALQTQEMFDRSKRKEMIGHVRNAASDAVEHTIEASVAAGRFAERGGYPNQRPVETPHFPNLQASGMQHPGVISSNGNINNMAPPVGRNGNEHTNWAGFSSQGNQGNQGTHVIYSVIPDYRLTVISRKLVYTNAIDTQAAPSYWKHYTNSKDWSS